VRDPDLATSFEDATSEDERMCFAQLEGYLTLFGRAAGLCAVVLLALLVARHELGELGQLHGTHDGIAEAGGGQAELQQLLQTVHSRYQNRYRNRVTNSTQAFSKSILK
jgi:hypothetical protein